MDAGDEYAAMMRVGTACRCSRRGGSFGGCYWFSPCLFGCRGSWVHICIAALQVEDEILPGYGCGSAVSPVVVVAWRI
jgi:hypothetical protein